MPFEDEDIHAVATAIKEYDETAVNKTWRDLALVAISAMSARGMGYAEPVPTEPDLEFIVARLHERFTPEVFGDERALDRICSIILGDEGYAKWLEIVEHQVHD